MKKIKYLIYAVIAAVTVWVAISWFDVTSQNAKPHPTYLPYNFFQTWCGEPEGNIRAVSASLTSDGELKDETGELWSYTFENTPDDNSFLLLWIDDNGTEDNVQDDIIIKVWEEVW
jgi:hypothetical protein